MKMQPLTLLTSAFEFFYNQQHAHNTHIPDKPGLASYPFEFPSPFHLLQTYTSSWDSPKHFTHSFDKIPQIHPQADQFHLPSPNQHRLYIHMSKLSQAAYRKYLHNALKSTVIHSREMIYDNNILHNGRPNLRNTNLEYMHIAGSSRFFFFQ